jgi:hypothetical protein
MNISKALLTPDADAPMFHLAYPFRERAKAVPPTEKI